MQFTRALLFLSLVPRVSCIRLTAHQTEIENSPLPVDPIWENIRKQMQHLLPDPIEDDAVRQIYENHKQIFSFGNQGRDVLENILKAKAVAAQAQSRRCVLMEIGVWFGNSTARWLNVHPNMAVVGIDPFVDPRSDHYMVKGVPAELREHFDHEKFNRRLAEYAIAQKTNGNEDRLIMIQGFSPIAAASVLEIPAAKVDAFYIDGGKQTNRTAFTEYINESLHDFYKHNPAAVFSGDDWTHSQTPTLQSTLKAFAAEKGLQLAQSQGRTWFMSEDLAQIATMKGITWVIKNPSTYTGPTVSEIIESTKTH